MLPVMPALWIRHVLAALLGAAALGLAKRTRKAIRDYRRRVVVFETLESIG